MRIFDIDYMKRIEILEIGNNCLKKVSKFVLEGFDELRSVSVGTNSFYLDKKNREGSKYVMRPEAVRALRRARRKRRTSLS